MLRDELYKSLIMKYESEIQEYWTTLMIYFDKSVAISDHPDHLLEMDKLIDKMTNANDKKNLLIQKYKSIYSKL